MGNFYEPNCYIPLSLQEENEEVNDYEFVCRLSMDIKEKRWSVEPYEFPTEIEEEEDEEEEQKNEDNIDSEPPQTTASSAISDTVGVNTDNTRPDDDELWDQVNKVLGDFETMKSDFQTMINSLGIQIQREHGLSFPVPVVKEPLPYLDEDPEDEEPKGDQDPKGDEEPKEAKE